LDDRVKPLDESAALVRVREAGLVESISALAAMLNWERTRAQRVLTRWQAAGLVTLEPGSGGRKIIRVTITVEAAHDARAPAAHPPAHDAHPAHPIAHPASWFRRAFRHSFTEWCRVVFGAVFVFSSIALFGASVFLNSAFWPGLAQSEDARPILAVFGFAVETSNYMIPSALTLVPMSRVSRAWVLVWLILTITVSAVAGASFIRSNLGAAEVSRKEINKERDRLQGIIGTPMTPVSDAAVVDARNRVETAKANRKSDCPRNKSLDIEVCNRAKAALAQVEADLATENTNHTSAVAKAEEQRRKDVADAQAKLAALPVISADKNIAHAGVAAILPWASESAVNGIVAGLWVTMFLIGPGVLLRFGLALLAPPRTT
jgi:hypothetical protein